MPTDAIFFFLVLIVSIILHEVSHGYMANWLGDPTARLAGRLTLNPLSHIDPVGSILLPAILLFTQPITGFPFLIGYAKPVPYNPYNLPGKYDEVLVAGAGPAVNIFLALIFSGIIRFTGEGPVTELFVLIVYINLLLALFNLIPVPPLDGSKVLSGILPPPLARAYDSFRVSFERLGILSGTLVILLLFYFLFPYFSALLISLLRLLTGL